ncbi:MAG: transaldolase [Candidatus Magasanikbacteria bacterium CG10_big_fil_rev_8_21_14_0_10_43_6]|uniref:Transaldolase n=1 Tax=Candidatus Magasanikbacteria bacterium CG10_big_fil_rev_8_21_14_0_10_43_6 TaxID=1974650 RepID=A0A2M6W0A5_9BACT|nr:MAG: transaldolase [Candidatus Magasanikbacteria bacterium CG10_big_fil_rev_8_21_14_0_10_43_6]
MARPENMHTRIFLDGSDLSEMDQIQATLGFLDGQTTNPSNFISALKKERGEEGLQFEQEALYALYKSRVQEISKKIPNGSVSIEVYADADTTAEAMIAQGKDMYTWIPNAHIKLPITTAGLAAAETLVGAGMRVNMTLCFSQEQAAAVYAATQGAKKGDVFISPFIGRVNDKGNNGMDLITNILKMYRDGDGHVDVLAASIRNGEQLAKAIAVGADITTSYKQAIDEWATAGMPVSDAAEFIHPTLSPIPYETLSLEKAWQEYHIQHDMTDDGLRRFAEDWNNLLTS